MNLILARYLKDRADAGRPDGRSGSGISVARLRDTPPQKPFFCPAKDLGALARTSHPYNWTAPVAGAIVGATV
jgi:hypothetical protein